MSHPTGLPNSHVNVTVLLFIYLFIYLFMYLFIFIKTPSVGENNHVTNRQVHTQHTKKLSPGGPQS